MRFLAGVASLICAVNLIIGKVFSWLALAIVVVCFTVVVQRYLFATSYVWMQDLYIWLNGAMFTAVAGFALLRDDHVRVDIFYRPAKLRTRAITDLIGVFVFLLPFTWIVYIYSMPFVQRAHRRHQGDRVTAFFAQSGDGASQHFERCRGLHGVTLRLWPKPP